MDKKTLTKQEIESYKLDLLDKYQSEYYMVSNYGYGDGACYGPFNALEALYQYCDSNDRSDPIENITKGLPWNPNYIASLITQFESALKRPGRTSGIHYITENDESSDFEDFMSS